MCTRGKEKEKEKRKCNLYFFRSHKKKYVSIFFLEGGKFKEMAIFVEI